MTQATSNALRGTPLGLIAARWELGKVGDFVAGLKAGVSVNGVETEHGCTADQVGVLKSSAVLQGKFFAEQHKVVVPADRARVATSVIADRIIISRMNTPTLVGESGYVAEDAPHLFLPDRLWQTEPSNEPHSQRWLSYWLQHPALRALITAAATGTSNSMKNISKETVLSLPVPRTPLAEQTKIAAILTSADDKLDMIARQIEATQTVKQGLLQTLFSKGIGSKSADGRWTGHTAFVKVGSAEYPKSWRMERMGDVAPLVRREVDVQPGETYPELGLRSFGKGTFHKPALTAEQVGSKRLFLIKAGDLLLSNVFAWEGAVAVAGPADDGRYGSHRYITCNVDPGIANVHFVARYLVTPAGLASIGVASPGGAGRNKTLGLAALADIQIPLPPLAEQNAINEVLECVEAKVAALQAKHELYRDLKRGLMQMLLSGEWRVKVDAEMAA